MSVEFLVLWGGLTLLGLALSSLFSGTETGFYTLNRVRLAVRAGRGDPRAKRLQWFARRPARLLSTLLVGNNIANFLGSYAIARLLAGMEFGQWEVITLNALVLTPLLFVFGETLPKDLFRTNTDRWTYALSGFMRTVSFVLTWTGLVPIVEAAGRLAGRLTGGSAEAPTAARVRVSQLLKEGETAGVLTEFQTTLADRALAFGRRTVEMEMVPWRDVATMPAEVSAERREAILRRVKFTRLPVVERGRAIGVVSLLDLLLEPERSVRELMEDLPSMPASTPVPEALERLRAQAGGVALVEGPGGRPVGIVTLKDLVEPLTGELAAW